MPIRILPPEIASKIAAGEVVERPASVVKELVENSIDAGAFNIKVEVRHGGRRLIRVVDDGCGIPAEEVELAFARYATSKISSAADLFHIRTLGFRGEALASIAAVSRVTLITRPQDQPTGVMVRVEGGRITHKEPRGCPVGTSVSVENLFYNVPARRKFLRHPATEMSHISKVVVHYALAYPSIKFTLVRDGQIAFQSPGTGEMADVLVKAYGPEVAQQLLELKAGEKTPSGFIRLHGYIAPPSLHKANRSHISFFVNSRWIQDAMLTKALIEAYHTFLPPGRYPMAIISITIDPGLVDVNVHPTKREIRFRNPGDVFSTLQKAVRHLLTQTAPVAPFGGFPAAIRPG
ncbi:MAG: DNA mismatch repair endonuclease MutL, partial [Chloroflexi bacterium]